MSEAANDFNLIVTSIPSVGFTRPDPNWKVNLSNLNYHIMAFCTGGEAQYTIDDKQYFVKKGDVLFFPKGKLHAGVSHPTDPWSFYVILFDLTFADDYSERLIHSLDSVIPKTNFSELLPLFQDIYYEWIARKTGYLLRCRCKIMEIFCLLLRNMEFTGRNSRHSEAIDSILNVMAENYKENYTIDQLCHLVGYSPSHFQFVFKKVTGKTVIQYQNEIKINKARDLLQYRSCNVTEAALHVGFNDIYYFSKLFKKTTGCNPSDFLKDG
ncbi:HTH-type transcriptional activator RhaR [Paenibacillus solanacearum]|uniref:HTH-type transcriptional activator RhaR n=1 Tax=Paenibacillus solanacearum TaxID=2048548 RepID=A0A916K426_9BACL|nr:AraC family transcriptional regulator [Paenibacillus solanacearum]CAG7622167.1 HTH-type transcriptional activator RhaR [Paenibacillus solanacearum]